MTDVGTLGRPALHVLPPLPCAESGLDLAISAHSIGLHYGKHHKGYVDTLNELLVGRTMWAPCSTS